MRQMNFESKLDEVARKPQTQITMDDAQDIQLSEVCHSAGLWRWEGTDSVQSRAFERRPRLGSVSDQVRSIASRNEALGMAPVAAEMAPVGAEMTAVGAEIPAYVTKDDARQAQRAESLVYGGQVPSYGMAASMQVSPRRVQAGMVLTGAYRARRISSTICDGIVRCKRASILSSGVRPRSVIFCAITGPCR